MLAPASRADSGDFRVGGAAAGASVCVSVFFEKPNEVAWRRAREPARQTSVTTCAALARFGGGSWPLCWAPLGVPRSWLWFGELLSLHQSWDLFAPAPNREDGWFVLPAQMVTGELRDVATGGPLDFARPQLPSAPQRTRSTFL